MDNKVSNLKCPKCGLVNFAAAKVCKRCTTAFSEPEEEGEHINVEPPQGAKAEPLTSQNTNLMSCPDCSHLCSRMAESCPNCGRILQQIGKPVGSILRPVIVVSVFVALCLGTVIVYLTMQRQAVVQAAVQSGDPAKAGVSSKNHEAARTALNAIGEIQSVTSVGTNYMQYTSTIQSAKIKYDAAIRDYKPQDVAEDEIKLKLDETLDTYVDASQAWGEFIQHGDEYGLISENDYVVKNIAARYGITSYEGDYSRQAVIKTIWYDASKKFNDVSARIH